MVKACVKIYLSACFNTHAVHSFKKTQPQTHTHTGFNKSQSAHSKTMEFSLKIVLYNLEERKKEREKRESEKG